MDSLNLRNNLIHKEAYYFRNFGNLLMSCTSSKMINMDYKFKSINSRMIHLDMMIHTDLNIWMVYYYWISKSNSEMHLNMFNKEIYILNKFNSLIHDKILQNMIKRNFWIEENNFLNMFSILFKYLNMFYKVINMQYIILKRDKVPIHNYQYKFQKMP